MEEDNSANVDVLEKKDEKSKGKRFKGDVIKEKNNKKLDKEEIKKLKQEKKKIDKIHKKIKRKNIVKNLITE